ncbi:FAD-binding oxidoreductase [Roseomonas sp. GC11]|uniref:NAD(P)/FAD-dependent oxidoreductase n=1 Tax=Roseomonas sp. GC11 TaxID=2950546 RepID=UPI0021086866|nr:FAD-binding oxidoreductase [Roseomonas sp. GC11]MCQ4160773.1 FAD-binding oxidoreductase [Roseomonas sp. GC11]
MTQHVVVIGAGIVGATTALEALRAGYRVTILDPGAPGGEQAASYGNGCWLSPQSVLPPAVPGTWKKVPRFLMDPLGPLSIRWKYFPRVLPWLLRYLWAGWTEEKVLRTARVLRPLLADGPARHQALAEQAGVPELISRSGLMYIFPDRAAYEAEGLGWRIRRAVGLTWREVEEDELRQREPDLDRRYRFGLLFEEAAYCRDPGAYVAALVALAEREGAVLRRAAATGFRIESGRLKAVRMAEGEILADRAVIAAGVHSRALAAQVGHRVPLQTERGYHAVLSMPEVQPRIPLMPSDGKMAVTPTVGGLRVAGQVEIAGVEDAPDWRRAEILRDWMLKAFPGLPRDLPAERIKFWMGHRPSMPDGLPCIGAARDSADVVLAFGHGHVGLVGGPRTAGLVLAILQGSRPDIALEPFDPRRFD